MLKEACDIPDDDSLKISQSLERIFLQNCSLFRCEKPAKRAKKASNAVKKARDLLKEAFDIPNDDSLKISRKLELIFLHNNQREIPIPPAPGVEPKKESVDEEKSKRLEQARDLLKETFDLPDDDSMKISQNLELIFLQNCAVQREIPIPPAPEVEGEYKLSTQMVLSLEAIS